MATGAGELPTWSPPLHRGANRMPPDRMPACHARQSRVTTDAELVDRFSEHEFIVGGVRIMACHTPSPGDNAVDKRYPILLAHEILLVAMTRHTEGCRTFSPELISIFTAVRVVAEGTSPDVQGPVGELHGAPYAFAGVAAEADLLDLRKGKSNPPGFGELLMAAEALLSVGRAVPPRAFVDDIRMAGSARRLFFQPHGLNGSRVLQGMAVGAALGEGALPVEKVDILTESVRFQLGLHGLKLEFDLLLAGKNGEQIHSRFQRQPEVQEAVPIHLHGYNRSQDLTGPIDFHPALLSGSRRAQNEMRFGVPGDDRGSRTG